MNDVGKGVRRGVTAKNYTDEYTRVSMRLEFVIITKEKS